MNKLPQEQNNSKRIILYGGQQSKHTGDIK